MPKIMLNGIEYASGLDQTTYNKIGDDPLTTTAQTLTGATNELNSGLTTLNSNLRETISFNTIITNTTDFNNFVINNVNERGQGCILRDSTKTIPILAKANVPYMYVIIIETQNVWNNHPEFIGFIGDSLYTGQLTITNNTVSINIMYKYTGTAL